MRSLTKIRVSLYRRTALLQEKGCSAGASGLCTMKCGDCSSRCYAEGLFVWARIKPSETPSGNIRGEENPSPAGDDVICCRNRNGRKNQRDTWYFFPRHPRNIETKSNDLCEPSHPSVTCHTRVHSYRLERVWCRCATALLASTTKTLEI